MKLISVLKRLDYDGDIKIYNKDHIYDLKELEKLVKDPEHKDMILVYHTLIDLTVDKIYVRSGFRKMFFIYVS